jgi:DNA-binding MarR family transcriptional regulator
MSMSSLRLAVRFTIVQRRLARDLDAAVGAHHGLSLSDLALLLELAEAPEGTLRRADLAARLGVTPSGVARQLGPLERIGVVTREPHDRDARLALVVLTPAGAELARNAKRTAADAAGRILGALWTDEEQHQLVRILAA